MNGADEQYKCATYMHVTDARSTTLFKVCKLCTFVFSDWHYKQHHINITRLDDNSQELCFFLSIVKHIYYEIKIIPYNIKMYLSNKEFDIIGYFYSYIINTLYIIKMLFKTTVNYIE